MSSYSPMVVLGHTDREPEEIRMIGDFNGSANALGLFLETKPRATTRLALDHEGRDGWPFLLHHCNCPDHVDPQSRRLLYSLQPLPPSTTSRTCLKLERQPGRPNGVLRLTKCCHPRSDFSTSFLSCPSFYPITPAAFPS
jgi:hypothetical protein